MKDGLSAYEIARENGYEGTVQDWLTALNGKSAYELAREGGYTGTESEFSAALAANAKGGAVGIKSASFNQAGELLLLLSDGSSLNVGRAVGAAGADGKNGAAGADGAAGVSIINAKVNEKGQLLLEFSDGKTVNLDKITGANGQDGQDGQDGVGIEDINIASGNLTVTLTGGTKLELGNIRGEQGDKGADGIGIQKSEINARGCLVLTYSDGTTSDLGLVVGKDGVGITNVTTSNDGVLEITLSNGEVKTLENIKGEKGDKGDKGDKGESGDKGDKGDAGRGIAKTELINGELWITYTDSDTPVNLGSVTGNKEQVDGDYIYVLLDDGTYGIKASDTFALTKAAIPADYNGVPVTQIMENGFANRASIAELSLPASLTKIGQHAFENCSNITTVTIPGNVNCIGAFAFYHTGLTAATLEKTATWYSGNSDFSWLKTNATSGDNTPYKASVRSDKLKLTSSTDVANALKAPVEVIVYTLRYTDENNRVSITDSKQTFSWCFSDWVRIDP